MPSLHKELGGKFANFLKSLVSDFLQKWNYSHKSIRFLRDISAGNFGKLAKKFNCSTRAPQETNLLRLCDKQTFSSYWHHNHIVRLHGLLATLLRPVWYYSPRGFARLVSYRRIISDWKKSSQEIQNINKKITVINLKMQTVWYEGSQIQNIPWFQQ